MVLISQVDHLKYGNMVESDTTAHVLDFGGVTETAGVNLQTRTVTELALGKL